MALKDWKKTAGNIWKKKNDLLELIRDATTNTFNIEIFLWETQSENAKNIVKEFSSESKALAYAKSYMRKN